MGKSYSIKNTMRKNIPNSKNQANTKIDMQIFTGIFDFPSKYPDFSRMYKIQEKLHWNQSQILFK